MDTKDARIKELEEQLAFNERYLDYYRKDIDLYSEDEEGMSHIITWSALEVWQSAKAAQAFFPDNFIVIEASETEDGKPVITIKRLELDAGIKEEFKKLQDHVEELEDTLSGIILLDELLPDSPTKARHMRDLAEGLL